MLKLISEIYLLPACTLNYQYVFKLCAGDGCLTGVGCVPVLDGNFTWQHVLSLLTWPREYLQRGAVPMGCALLVTNPTLLTFLQIVIL